MTKKSDIPAPPKRELALACAAIGIIIGVAGYYNFASGIVIGSALFGIPTLVLGIQIVRKEQTIGVISIVLGSLLILYPIILISYFLANFELRG